MTLFEAIILAVAISLDAFVVSFSIGMFTKNIDKLSKYRFLIIIGLFHVFMPLVGFFLTKFVYDIVEGLTHFIAFAILSYLGVKMIIDGARKKITDINSHDYSDYLSLKNTIYFGFALSVDAIIVGFSIGVQKINIISGSQLENMIIVSLISGFCAFVIPCIGMSLGKRVIGLIPIKAEILGGVIIIALGLKILITG